MQAAGVGGLFVFYSPNTPNADVVAGFDASINRRLII